jgi:hypothetical protein
MAVWLRRLLPRVWAAFPVDCPCLREAAEPEASRAPQGPSRSGAISAVELQSR